MINWFDWLTDRLIDWSIFASRLNYFFRAEVRFLFAGFRLFSCRWTWSLRWSERANLLVHRLQAKGLVPSCLRLCLVSSSDRANVASHSSRGHTNGRSPTQTTSPSLIILDCELSTNHSRIHVHIQWRLSQGTILIPSLTMPLPIGPILPPPYPSERFAIIHRRRGLSTLGRHFCPKIYLWTRNTLDCDPSNYSSRIVFSHIPIEIGQKRISAIRSADHENPILEPNTE